MKSFHCFFYYLEIKSKRKIMVNLKKKFFKLNMNGNFLIRNHQLRFKKKVSSDLLS